MENNLDIRKSILDQPSYWTEKLNMDLYDALITYQESHKLKKGDLAKYLGISASRLSQILNDGESNFTTSTLFSILIKLDQYPKFEFVQKAKFLQNEREAKDLRKPIIIELNLNDQFFPTKKRAGRPKIIHLSPQSPKLDLTQDVGSFNFELEEM